MMHNWKLWFGLTALALVLGILGAVFGQRQLLFSSIFLFVVFWLMSLLQRNQPKGYGLGSLGLIIVLLSGILLFPNLNARPNARKVLLSSHVQKLYTYATVFMQEEGARAQAIADLLEANCQPTESQPVKYKTAQVVIPRIPPDIRVEQCVIRVVGNDDFSIQLQSSAGTFGYDKDGLDIE